MGPDVVLYTKTHKMFCPQYDSHSKSMHHSENTKIKLITHLISSQTHSAGDVTRVSVVPRKVTVKSGMARIGDGDAEIQID